jgi:hypothetical protein
VSLAGLSETEITDLFRHAADELEKIRENDAAKKPSYRRILVTSEVRRQRLELAI